MTVSDFVFQHKDCSSLLLSVWRQEDMKLNIDFSF